MRALGLVALIIALLTAASVTRAAPPSSAMTSPELMPPEALPKSKQATTTYKCTGYYKSYDCESTLYLNDCKHSIKIDWSPLKIPGSLEWARTHRNWCSVTYTAAEYIEERKLKPEKCDGLVRLLAAGLQGFAEVPWQDAQCTHIGTPDGILYVTQHYTDPTPPGFLADLAMPPEQARAMLEKKKKMEVEPRAVRLEDVRSCTLHVDKKHGRYARCPVLTPVVHEWLAKFLKYLEVGIVIQNPKR